MLERVVPPEAYDAAYYAKFFPEDGYLRRELERRTRAALRHGALRTGHRILDIGCGPGDLAVRCAQAGCRVSGIDYSNSAIKLAQGKLSNYPTQVRERVSFEVMNAGKLEFPAGHFDRVFMIDVVEHLNHRELTTALREALRVLRRPGKLVIRTAPNAWLVKPMYGIARLLIRAVSWDTEFYHVNELTPWTMSRYLKDLGEPYRVIMGKANDDYFSEHLPAIAGPWLRKTASLIDLAFDSTAVNSLVYSTPMKFVLGTEIWGVVEAAENGKP